MHEPPEKKTIETLFQLALEAEKAARSFYQGLAQKFRHVPEVAAIWQQMMRDEAAHIHRLEEIHVGLTPEQLGASVDADIYWKALGTRRFSAEHSLGMIRDLEDAFQLAHDLEHSEINALFEFILSEFIDHETQRDLVLSQLKEHVARLEALEGPARRRGITALDS